jgi:hypothetical protein
MNNTKLATFNNNAIRYNAIATMAVVVMLCGEPFLHAATRAVPGEQRRWALDFRTRLEQPGNARPIEIDLSGDWISTVSAVRPGEYDAVLQLANMRIGTAANAVPADQSESVRRRLSRPFWATYRDDGSMLAVHFFKDMDPSDRNMLQMIATECQFVRAAVDRTSWTVRERDGAGECLASYDRANANTITKHKLKYVRTEGAPGNTSDSAHVEIDQSEYRFTVDSDGDLVAMDGRIRVRMGVSAKDAGQLTAVTVTQLSGLRKSQAPELIGSLARALPGVVSSAVRAHQTDHDQLRARLDSELLDGWTTEALLGAARLTAGKEKGQDGLMQDRLAALFRQRPDAASAALAMLRKSGPDSRITDALGFAGSPAAVQTLAAIARDRNLPSALRIDALTAFALMQHPSAEAMRVPAALLDAPDASGDAAVASAARLAMGALARAGRPSHPEEAKQLDAALVTRYRATLNAAELAELLSAMGNSSGASVVPVIEGALRDQRDGIRAAAVRALRLAPGGEVEGLLCAAITNDRDADVRAAAIFAASFRQPIGSKLGSVLIQAAKTDSAEHVRVRAITLLRQHPGVVPNLGETLEWIAQHDSKPGVRRLAQEALKNL